MFFPSYYLDLFLYRDEKNVNVSLILPPMLHLDFRDDLNVTRAEEVQVSLSTTNLAGINNYNPITFLLIPR